MSADRLALIVDPVAWLLAILGALGFVGIAILLAIQCGRHQQDAAAWTTERRRLHAERKRLLVELRDAYADHIATGRELVEAWGAAADATSREADACHDAAEAYGQFAVELSARSDEEALDRHHAAAAAEGLTEAPPHPPNGQIDPRWS